ncbi:MAG: hypothetical protein PHN88_01820 [Ignavibacteria bacterium]|nr:hypothetical protein [Ignavibacteria bacterium]
MGYIFFVDKYAFAVVISLTIITYIISLYLQRKIDSGLNTSLLHKTGIIILIAVLFIFKYLGFLNTSINYLLKFVSEFPKINTISLFVPLGLSYIILRYISYLTDIHWKIIKAGNFLSVLLYGSLFTTFVAGPIDRFERIQPQLLKKIEFSFDFVEYGFIRMVFGLAKKFIVADWVGYFIGKILTGNEYNDPLVKAAALLGYSLQIYLDFSGYSDIAIGSSRLFGLTIMENFNNPYLKSNISQFWRSWHISLSDWIRDYLFFPLGALSNKKIWQIFFVPLIAMGLCGLWHGAQWHFVIWGIWHGTGISIYQFWNYYKRKNKKIAKIAAKPIFSYLAVAITFSFVTIGWLFFL